jgi:hypothetical protein
MTKSNNNNINNNINIHNGSLLSLDLQSQLSSLCWANLSGTSGSARQISEEEERQCIADALDDALRICEDMDADLAALEGENGNASERAYGDRSKIQRRSRQ